MTGTATALHGDKPSIRRPTNDPFIVMTSGSVKPDSEARKYIRSHVMRGKNRKRVSRKENFPIGSWINNQEGQEAPRHTISDIPRSLAPDVALVNYAADIKPEMMELVFKWFTSLKQAIYPVEVCMEPDLDTSQWVSYLAYDKAYIYSVLFTTRAFFDYIRDQTIGREAIAYLQNSLEFLRLNLADRDAQTSDSTIAVVLSLALMSDLVGDSESAEAHLKGLSQMVKLRGGINALRSNSQLQKKVCRTDLQFSLSTGKRPVFFTDNNMSWSPFIAKEKKQSSKSTMHQAYPRSLDQRLLNVWLDLQEFSRSANIAFQTGRKIPGSLFQEAVTSALYRLIALQHDQGDTTPVQDTIMRLGMLAFSTTTFLQIQGLPADNNKDLSAKARTFLQLPQTVGQQQFGTEAREEFLKLKLWFLFVAYITILSRLEDEELIVANVAETVTSLGLSSWPGVREVLLDHMWIDWLDFCRSKAQALLVKALAWGSKAP
ncbi:hypothetical protein B0T25DRAFT_463449 [Lasiosphaeria hispida]|uniref:Transcription factor domain-containing protein n=1 Tax=Lasiosphaeria hispida TaxID=260671 RepID=A0AAJ0H9M5_9PEZI|nr:hypothetical protein B0T25DRAFT_463449 [Lasiosphaeria hispida]